MGRSVPGVMDVRALVRPSKVSVYCTAPFAHGEVTARSAAAYQTVRCAVCILSTFLAGVERHGRRVAVKIIAYDRFKPGVTMDTIKPYIREEVANVWRLWKAGIVRENYARADVNGVVIVFECHDVK